MKNSNSRRKACQRLVQAMATVALGLGCVVAKAAEWPRQITIVVPFPPGGVTDQLARGIGQKLAENLKTTVVVDNRPGGGAQVAAHMVKQAPADGSMIFIGDIGAFALNQALYSKLNYNIQKDFTPLARLALAPSFLVVPADSAINSMADFIATARKQPLNVASQSTGSGGHLFIELIQQQAGIKLNHVPYRGSAPALNDLVGKQVDAFFDPLITSSPFVKDGKLKALAIGIKERSSQYPQVPTLSETGWGRANVVAWFAMAVRAGTPDGVTARLSDEVIKAMRSPDLVRRFTDQGLEVAPMAHKEFASFLDTEIKQWGQVIRAADIRLD